MRASTSPLDEIISARGPSILDDQFVARRKLWIRRTTFVFRPVKCRDFAHSNFDCAQISIAGRKSVYLLQKNVQTQMLTLLVLVLNPLRQRGLRTRTNPGDTVPM